MIKPNGAGEAIKRRRLLKRLATKAQNKVPMTPQEQDEAIRYLLIEIARLVNPTTN